MPDVRYLAPDHRTTTDDVNPRVYHEEWRCHACGEWFEHEDVVFANPATGALETENGEPFCPSCVPPEE